MDLRYERRRATRRKTTRAAVPALVLLLALTMVLALPAASASATIHPHILSLNVTSGVPGTSVTITGYGFGATQALSSNVGFSAFENAGSITSWSDTQIVCTVPTLFSTPYGLHYVNVWDTGGYYSNEMKFVVEDPTLWIHSLSPTHGAPGKTVTVAGHGFGVSQGASQLMFFGGAGYPPYVSPVISWSDATIKVAVPAGIAVGAHEVFVVVGSLSNPVIFNVDPAIKSITPAKAYPGTTVTIKGTGFGKARGTSKIYFGTKAATSYVSWSDTQIKVKVPLTSAGSHPVKVKTKFGTTKTKSFKVL